MCGISGFIDKGNKLNKQDLINFNRVLKHRGPDDEGVYLEEASENRIGLAHVRLSVLDLSKMGHQPMHFQHLHIVLNGEIYNFQNIRKELQNLGYTFQSFSDTEVVLKAFDAWGLHSVEKFIGMYAFSIYDSKARKIYLCRDRPGVKPLYYFYSEDYFVFGSEMKVFFSLKDFPKEINYAHLKEFLKFGYTSGKQTLLNGIHKLQPGSWLEFDINRHHYDIIPYWKLSSCYSKGKIKIDYTDAVEECEQLIKSSCDYRMVSDVPVGIFLSGGYDSSLVTAMLQKDRSQKLKTFTIGFPDGADESVDAENVAKHLGTKHTTYQCTYQDAKKLIPILPEYYDEPIGDISCIPTMLVSKLARQEVKVALSGDGADEIFAGYSGYKTFVNFIQKTDKIPLKTLISIISKNVGNLAKNHQPHIYKRLLCLSEVLKYQDNRRYEVLTYFGSGVPDSIINFLVKDKGAIYNYVPTHREYIKDEPETLLIADFENSLREMLLPKIDRATMAFSLEGREPLLDHRLVEYAAQLPFEYKYDGKTNKKIIKEIVHKYIPKEIMDRPKTGFDLPIFDWLQNDLKYLIEEFLSKEAIEKTNCFEYKAIIQLTTDFHNNRLRYKNLIWNLIVFQMWYFYWINK